MSSLTLEFSPSRFLQVIPKTSRLGRTRSLLDGFGDQTTVTGWNTPEYEPWSYVPTNLTDLLEEWHRQVSNVGNDQLTSFIKNFESPPYHLLLDIFFEPEVENYRSQKQAEEVDEVLDNLPEDKKKKIEPLATDVFVIQLASEVMRKLAADCDDQLFDLVFKLRGYRFTWDSLGKLLGISGSAAHQRYSALIAEKLQFIMSGDDDSVS
jgi:hypothetical protein